MSKTKSETNISFEQAFTELKDIVSEMEKGDLSLEQALDHYEKGILITRRCQEILKTAETRIQILKENAKELTPFDANLLDDNE